MRATSTTPLMIRLFPRAGRSYVRLCGPRSAILPPLSRQPPPPAPVRSSPCGVLLQSTWHAVGDWRIQAIFIPRARAPGARGQRQAPGRPMRGPMRRTNSTTYSRSTSRKRKGVTEPSHTCPAPCATSVDALTRTTRAQASYAISHMRATNVGMVRPSGSRGQTADNVVESSLKMRMARTRRRRRERSCTFESMEMLGVTSKLR
jgi:hypothetical protein